MKPNDLSFPSYELDEEDDELSLLTRKPDATNTKKGPSLFQLDYRYRLFHDPTGVNEELNPDEAEFINGVINKVISPINVGYEKQMHRLAWKENRMALRPLPLRFDTPEEQSAAFLWMQHPPEPEENMFPPPLSTAIGQKFVPQPFSPIPSEQQNKPVERPQLLVPRQILPENYYPPANYYHPDVHYYQPPPGFQEEQEVGTYPTQNDLPPLQYHSQPFVPQQRNRTQIYTNPNLHPPAKAKSDLKSEAQEFIPISRSQELEFSTDDTGEDEVGVEDFKNLPAEIEAHQAEVDLKAQLQVSPATKQKYKDFFKTFKEKEKEGGFAITENFVKTNEKVLPEKIRWKIYLELADLAKREKNFEKATDYYSYVNKQQPYAGKGWLEYAKMEEESGNLSACSKILETGLFYCPIHEGLLVKGIKHNEKMGRISAARALLARLKNVAIDRSWRTIMEGGMLEARQGNIPIARQIFKYLMMQVPLYGPIYTEAVRLEFKMEDYKRGLNLVDRGLDRIPSYGPLWFLALKLEERLDGDYRKRVQTAIPKLSKELLWKIWFDLAQIEDRKGQKAECAAAYVKAVVNCPKNLIWKVWLGGARTEIHNKNYAVAEKLLHRAKGDVPAKMRATVLVDVARYLEYCHKLDEARAILDQAKKDSSHEWKVFLESILIEIRAQQLKKALVQVQEALKVHASTGRLWAILIQLTHLIGLGSDEVGRETSVFVKAMTTVPKSGEVWCEGARLALHQNLTEHAKRYLAFAIQFTPQYGDSFVEYLRIVMLEILNALQPDESFEDKIKSQTFQDSVNRIELLCINAEPTYGVCWAYCREDLLDSSRRCFANAKKKLIEMALIAEQIKRGTFKYPKKLTESQVLVYSRLDIAACFLGLGVNETPQDDEFRFKTIFN